MKHAKFTIGGEIFNIDKMSSKELNSAIKKFSAQANVRLERLKKSGYYEFSNTIGRFHEPRLEKDYVGTKKGTFRRNISGSIESKRDRLHYMLAFIIDPQTNPEAVEEYVKDDIHHLFGERIDLEDEGTFEYYKSTLRAIYDAYRALGFDREWKDSNSILTNMAKIVNDNPTEMTPELVSTQMSNLMSDAAKYGYTIDDISDFFAGRDTLAGSKTEEIRQFLEGNLHLSSKVFNTKTGEAIPGLHFSKSKHLGRG